MGEMQTNSNASDFLPRMVLRILLIEADDSTRQIIAALLRKCNYKVAAFCDGLKAWETLKDKASDIDLILTEVDLPSISGFSLLTLIMEHDICKNIPVIMMSSHDSVSMVFKCMLKGAVDFLIKPVRKNELRNLWQHVWRRHAISKPTQNLTLPQIELGFAAENHATSNDSSGSVASTPKDNECSEKTSEAHVSLGLGQDYECRESRNQEEGLRIELSTSIPEINPDIHGCSDELVDPSTGAIDLIATFKNLPKSIDEKCNFSGGNTAEFDFDTQLGLSLRRDFPGSSSEAASEERQILSHSNASAFSRYSTSKLLQPLFPKTSTISAKLTDASENSQESHKLSENASISHQYGGENQIQEKITIPVTGQAGQVDPKSPNSQLGSFPATGVFSDHKSTGNGNVFPSMFDAQAVVHPLWTPKSVSQKESSPFLTSTSSQSNPQSHNSEHHHWSEDATHASDQNVKDQSNLDCQKRDSPAASQSAITSFYHDTTNHNGSDVYRSIDCRSGGNATSAKVVKDSHESLIDSSHCSYDGFIGIDSHCTSQREAALTKFRLKRKDRCYEKKVRYQSRKRLAEQRPRVKGQFVRQSTE